MTDPTTIGEAEAIKQHAPQPDPLDNMRFYNRLRRIDPKYLKVIDGGDIAGMTDIKPSARYEMLTKVFGPYGEGWHFDIIRRERFEVGEGESLQVLVTCEVALFISTALLEDLGGSTGSCWGQASHAIGCAPLMYRTSKGYWKVDDTAPMKAQTSAQGKACEVLGVGADIYLGLYDSRTGYRDGPAPAQETQDPPRGRQSPPAAPGPQAPAMHPDVKAAFGALSEAGYRWKDGGEEERAQIETILDECYGIRDPAKLHELTDEELAGGLIGLKDMLARTPKASQPKPEIRVNTTDAPESDLGKQLLQEALSTGSVLRRGVGTDCVNPKCRNRWPCVDHPMCPNDCGSECWDNREAARGGKGKFPKSNAKAPDFKCKKKCGGMKGGDGWWPDQWQDTCARVTSRASEVASAALNTEGLPF